MKPEITLKEVKEFYFSRLIDSLENDYKEWERTRRSGFDYSFYTHDSPEYKNKEGERLQFIFSFNCDGAYINGRIGWTIGFWQRWNLFSYRTRRFWKAKRTMIKHLKQLELKEYKEKLMKSL